jgi:hypothetical protein
MDSIKYKNETHTDETLAAMSVEELTSLRNTIAADYNLAGISRFASRPKGVAGCILSLEQVRARRADKEYVVVLANAQGVAAAEVPPANKRCNAPEEIKRPTPQMFGRIRKLGTPTTAQRASVWPDFTDGMRLIDAMTSPAHHAGKILWWMKQSPPLIALDIPEAAALEAEMREWYTAQGRDFPGVANEEAKAEKAAERAAAKAVRDAAKEAKAAERATAKAERDAAKEVKAAEVKATKATAEVEAGSRRAEMEARKAAKAAKTKAAVE